MRSASRIHLYSRLSLYLRSGIPIREALSLIRSSAKKHDALLLAQIEEAVVHGISLSQALSIFPPFETHLIEVGERSGSLPQNLAYLSSLLVRRRTLKRKLQSALIYPCIIMVGSFGVTLFLFLYTFPKILPIFEGLHTPLPLSTRMLIALSNVVTEHGMIVLVLISAFVITLLRLIRVPRFMRAQERVLLRTPLIRNFIRSYMLSLISRTLSTLLTSGISLVTALEHVGRGSQSHAYRIALTEVGMRVNEGQGLSAAFSAHSLLFPHAFNELVAAGEATGSLSGSLATCADMFEEELDEYTRTLTTLIEPVLMIVMGLLIGFVSMAIISPIYSMTQGIP